MPKREWRPARDTWFLSRHASILSLPVLYLAQEPKAFDRIIFDRFPPLPLRSERQKTVRGRTICELCVWDKPACHWVYECREAAIRGEFRVDALRAPLKIQTHEPNERHFSFQIKGQDF